MSELRLGISAVSMVLFSFWLLTSAGAPEIVTFSGVVFVAFPIGLGLGVLWDGVADRAARRKAGRGC